MSEDSAAPQGVGSFFAAQQVFYLDKLSRQDARPQISQQPSHFIIAKPHSDSSRTTVRGGRSGGHELRRPANPVVRSSVTK